MNYNKFSVMSIIKKPDVTNHNYPINNLKRVNLITLGISYDPTQFTFPIKSITSIC